MIKLLIPLNVVAYDIVNIALKNYHLDIFSHLQGFADVSTWVFVQCGPIHKSFQSSLKATVGKKQRYLMPKSCLILTLIRRGLEICEWMKCWDRKHWLSYHYELQQYFSSMGKLKIWAVQEDQILIKVSHMIKSKKWKKASQELKKAGYERSDVECRERFINHLDPTVNKELWSDEELQILYAKYDEYGNKWFLLQKHLPGRTQTKIKNYFYGNIRYLLKIIVKYFFKKSTGFINDIKTETLLDMYQGKNCFQDDFLIHRTIKRLRYRVEKKLCQKLIKESEDDFYNFTQKFLNSQNEKNESVSESDDIYPENNSPKLVKIECQPMVICSTGGDIDDKKSQLEYLKMMATNHLKWYEFYNNNYLSLLKKVDEDKTSRE